MYFDNGNIATGKLKFSDIQVWLRQHIPIGTDCRKIQEQFIRHGQTGKRSIVFNSNKQITRPVMIRQIIGKSTDCTTELIGVLYRCRAFDVIRLQIIQQCNQFMFGQHSASGFKFQVYPATPSNFIK